MPHTGSQSPRRDRASVSPSKLTPLTEKPNQFDPSAFQATQRATQPPGYKTAQHVSTIHITIHVSTIPVTIYM